MVDKIRAGMIGQLIRDMAEAHERFEEEVFDDFREVLSTNLEVRSVC